MAFPFPCPLLRRCSSASRGMSRRSTSHRFLPFARRTVFAVLFLVTFSSMQASAQESTPSGAQHAHAENETPPQQDASMAGMQMSMNGQNVFQLPSPHEGSGTAWQPTSVHGTEWMGMRGGWEFMAHGAIFVDYNQQGGPRGAGKAESVNWGMLMEQHKLARAPSCSGRCFPL